MKPFIRRWKDCLSIAIAFMFVCISSGFLVGQGIIPNSKITVDVKSSPEIIKSADEEVRISYVVRNVSSDPLTDVVLTPRESFFRGGNNFTSVNATFLGDPNGNRILDPGEEWAFELVKTFDYSRGDTYILSAGIEAVSDEGPTVGGGADMLFTSGVNMDISVDQECLSPGDKIDVTLTTRLLIDEDAAVDPGTITIIVGGVPIEIQLAATQWEARDLMITGTELNGGAPFDPFNPPAGIDITQFCDQGNADAGRNSGNVLDELEPINTVREPCTFFGENDEACEFPDWSFCYCVNIPVDFDGDVFPLEASDDFTIWKAEENPPGSGMFGPFVEVTDQLESGGMDELDVTLVPTAVAEATTPICGSDEVTLIGSNSTGTDLEYFWYDENDVLIYSGTDPDFMTTFSGDTDFTLIVTSMLTNCSDTAMVDVLEPLCGNISGNVTEDIDNDDDGDTGLEGVEIKLLNDDGTPATNELGDPYPNAVTDADGNYTFTDIPVGNYLLMEIQPDGYSDVSEQDETDDDTTDSNDTNFNDNMIPVELTDGENDLDNNFIEEQVGTISGTVFIDDDNDDTGDTAFEGIEIKLLDDNLNPAVDQAGNPVPNEFTDVNGFYEFTNLPAGDYVVMEIQPAGYTNVFDEDTTDDDSADTNDNNFMDDMIPVELAPGEDDENNDFVEELVGTISGFVLEDVDNDDSGDDPLESVQIKLLASDGSPAVYQDGSPVPNQFTDANGYYEFTNLPSGDYIVMEVQPTNYEDVTDEDMSDDDATDANDTTFDDNMIPVSLLPGEMDSDNNFVEEQVGTISGTVTEDDDNDDDGDAGIAGVEIKLLDGDGNPAVDQDGNPVPNQFTNGSGFYEFTNLAPGSYIVMEIQPADYFNVADEDESDDDATDVADTMTDDDMIPVELAPGEDDEDNNFIEEQVGTISGIVEVDINNDDVGDEFLEGVEIKLLNFLGNPALDQAGNPIANVFTDANGFYEFTNVPTGDYFVMEIQPDGYTDVYDEDTSDDDDTDTNDASFMDNMIPVFLEPGEDDENNDFLEEEVGTISGTVSEDIDNDDTGDNDLAGVEIKLLNGAGGPAVDADGNFVPNTFTNGAGYYEFTNLPTGDYIVMEIQPSGFVSVSDQDTSDDDGVDVADTNFSDDMIPVFLAPGEDDDNNDFVEEMLGSISGSVGEDVDNDDDADLDMENVEIKLLNGDGSPAVDGFGNPVANVFTDSNGEYVFENLAAGSYIVMEIQPAGYGSVSDEDTSDDDGVDAADTVFDDDMIPVELAPGEEDADNDFIEEQIGSITGFVLEDTDNDDEGEEGLENVELKLLDGDGNPAVDQAGDPVANVFTDANGAYTFDNLAPGDYIVMEIQPADYLDVSDEDTSNDDLVDANDTNFSDDMIPVSLDPGEEDAGNTFVEEQVGTISGTVTEDIDNNDTGDEALEGIEIKLLDENGNPAVDQAGNVVANVFTDANGFYEFTNLPTGMYIVMEIQPTEYTDVSDQDNSDDDATDTADTNFDDNMIPVDLAPGEDDEDNDFVEEQTGSISGTVTEDVDNDDTGDQALENVEIKLLDENGNPAVDVDGNVVANEFTDMNGMYTFTDLPAGEYIVMEIQPTGFEDVTEQDTSDDDATDIADANFNDNMIPVTLEAGESDEDNDFVEEQLGTISGNVSEDTNNDDAGEENLENVEIKLLDENGNPAVDGFGNPVANIFTDSNGNYTFENMPAGNYIVMEIQPAGYVSVSDEDESDDDGTDTADTVFDDDMIPVELAAGEDDEDNNFIEEQTGSISGTVTEDTNNDDIGDTGIENVEIKLLDENGNPAVDVDGNVVANVFTDADGNYTFDNLATGNYIVMEVQPADYENVSDEDTSDDDNTDTADMTFDDDMIPVELAPGEDDEDNDFVEEQTGTISGTVTEDIDNDDSGDQPLEGVEIKLLDENGNPALDVDGNVVANVFTDMNGVYTFTNLPAGEYIVMEVQPAGFENVNDQDNSDDDATDIADVNFNDDMIPVTLAAGEDDEDNDFVEEQLGTISGNVSEDTNNDDVGEENLENVEIKLLDENGNPAVDGFGNPVANIFTDANGNYTFENIAAGNYIVMEIQPADYASVSDEDESDDDATDTADTVFDDDMIPVELAAGEDDEDNNFIEEQTGTISGTVTEDTDNDGIGDVGIENVEIKLLDENGDPALDQEGNPVANVFTDSNGNYSFDNLPTGNYIVMEIQPDDYENVSDEDTSDDDATDVADMDFEDDMIPVELAPGEDDEDNGFVEEQLGSISGNVSKQTTTIDGAGVVTTVNVPVQGVSVVLLDENGTPLETAMTDMDGNYVFLNYPPGNYSVTTPIVDGDNCVSVSDEDESTGPDDPDGAPDPVDEAIPVTLDPGEDDEDNNFVDEALGTIQGTVTEDIDNDDDGDEALEGVEIKLLDENGNPAVDGFGMPVANEFTGAGGNYSFENLLPGNYTVMEIQPMDYEDVTESDTSDDDVIDTGDAATSDNMIPVFLESGEDDLNNDFVEERPGSISGTVMVDNDNDDNGDDPLEGVEIKLLNADGSPAVDVFGNPVANEFTDVNGAYSFENIAPGDYIVMEVQPDGYSDVSDEDESDDDTTDENDTVFDDDMIPVTLTPGENDADNNFVEEPLGTVSGTVEKQGILFDDDGEAFIIYVPIEDVEITLLDSDGVVFATTMTDASGNYTFEDVPTGTYTVVSADPEPDCVDISDEDESTGPDDPDGGDDPVDNMIPVEVEPGEDDENNDFVDGALANIGNYVFFDMNEDGIQDIEDVGVEGVEVSLFEVGPDGLPDTGDETLFDLQVTNDDGLYLFTDVPAGEYYVYFDPTSLPDGYIFTLKDEGANDITDSDPDANGFDDPFMVYVGQLDDLDHDAGIIVEDPCADYVQGAPNTVITAGVVVSPDIIGSEDDIVNVTFVVVNLGSEPMTNVVVEPHEELFSGEPYVTTLNPIFSGDPNNNGQLDPGEIWFFTAVKSYEYSQGDVFIISVGVTGDVMCGTEVGAAADLLFTSGVNMDVNIDQDEVAPGDVIDVNLITRLLINEDAAKDPGVIIVGGIPIQLPESRWEARDLMITVSGINNGDPFDPYNPPAGVEITNYSDQGGIDAGRNTNNILDECEPINTVREPCTAMGENDDTCEFPDVQHTISITIPADYDQETFTVTATDEFSVWKADENPAGSGMFDPFVDVSDMVETGGSDEASVMVSTVVLPVELTKFDARANGSVTLLNWETSSEINNSHFVIERSADGHSYESIGEIAGNGTTATAQTYSFTDRAPLKGFNYYRLAQYDYDGSVARSNVKIVDFSYIAGSGNVRIYPNPISDHAIFESENIIGDISVHIFDALGRKVVDQVITTGASMNLSNLSPGHYNFKVYDQAGYEIASEKMTIVR